MTSSGRSSVFVGFRFLREVISVAVRWYLRHGLSYRDVEELLAERGVTVDHVTVCRWVQRFTPDFVEAARFSRHAPGDRWFADEAYVKIAGRRTCLYRAVDQHGQVIDVLVSQRRDLDMPRSRRSWRRRRPSSAVIHGEPCAPWACPDRKQMLIGAGLGLGDDGYSGRLSSVMQLGV